MKREHKFTVAKKIHPLWPLFFLMFLVPVLFPAIRSLIINTGISAADVYIDNTWIGKTAEDGSLFIPAIETGQKLIEVRRAGYENYRDKIEVTDLSARLDIHLNPAAVVDHAQSPGAVRGHGVLYVYTNVGSVDIFIDGQLKGKTRQDGSLVLEMAAGNYVIEGGKNGYKTAKGSFILEDMAKQIRLDLSVDEGGPDLLMFGVIGLFLLIVVAIGLIIVNISRHSAAGTIGRFRLKETVGKGGMAVVYKVDDPQKKSEAALKLMDVGLLKDRDLVEKFLREGEAIIRINNSFPQAPVVKVFEFGKIGTNPAIPYILMEYLKGPSLLEIFKKKGRMPQERALWFVKRIAEGLQAAHANQIFHRDVTSDNVIVVKSFAGHEDIRLIDFGVAKHEYTSYQTLDGSIAGKPPYMSPEQCKGGKVGPESDIYSLGIILYLLLEGKPPFTSQNPLEIMKMHETARVPELTMEVHPAANKLLKLMLDKNPGARPDAGMVMGIINNILQQL